MLIIKQQYIEMPCKARPGLPLNHPTSIYIHWIGPYPNQTPYDVIAWWVKSGNAASAQFVIKDELCVSPIPENEVAWHCGTRDNYSSIGIECIPMNKAGEFSADTIDTLVALLKHLPKVELRRHFDATGKDCPRFYTDVMTDAGVDGRVENPPGGEDRWLELKDYLERSRNEC
jgi:hypothetical protein